MTMDRIAGIYKIKCILTNRCYVGSSIHMFRRISDHKLQLRKGMHHSRQLQRAWDKYGESNFEFSIVRVLIGAETPKLICHEQYYISKFLALGLSLNGSKIAGRPCVDPARISRGQKLVAHKHRAKALRQWANPEMRARMLKGIRAANSKRKGQKNPKRSIQLKEHYKDPANRAKLSHVVGPEQRQKHSQFMKNYWKNPAARKQTLATRSIFWENSEHRLEVSRKTSEYFKNNPEARERQSLENKRRPGLKDWVEDMRVLSFQRGQDPSYIQFQSTLKKLQWADPIWRARTIARQNEGRRLRVAKLARLSDPQ